MNILLTSAGRRTYLVEYFKQALEDDGKVYASNSIMTYTLRQADGFVLTPQIYDAEYVDFLINYCTDNNIEAIISLFDIDLAVLANAKSKFAEHGIKVIVSDSNVISICNDKWKTYLFLNEIGVPTPKTYLNLSYVKNALAKGEIDFPLFMKPRWGMGSIGIYKVDNEEELGVLYKKLKRQIFDTYLKFESSEDSEQCILVQECIDGSEYGLDVLNDLNGNYVTTIAKQKIAMRSGETDIACIVDNEPFESIGRLLSEKLRHIANLDADCFKTPSGKIYVLELNCRFGGQYPFSHLAGVNFPKQIVEWLHGKPSDKNLYTPTVGTTSCKDLVPVLFS